ncbi:MAG: SGNH/GDSL hydrolase family protein [Oscillospiraceae bacterium]|nr:SGNH/GDSL hydrolase family protein [Oscillospiraceae bacterium]
MKNKEVFALTATFTAAATAGALAAVRAKQRGWKLIYLVRGVHVRKHPGNAPEYAPHRQARLADSVLTGKRIFFLGSSVTIGSGGADKSFADFLAVRNGCKSIIEAVPGTTLVDNGSGSYIPRLKAHKVSGPVDLMVCQLSTNDARLKLPMGAVSEGFDKEAMDITTIAGAIEYINAYARDTWGCPVAFYISPRYENPEYPAMVQLMYTIAEKWNVFLIDMWNDEAFNNITPEQRKLYMADPVHPTRAGYLQWWTPFFEAKLKELFSQKK